MVRRKGKSVSFDAMVKFFMHAYQIPTKRDVDKILGRIDRLEALLAQAASGAEVRRRASARRAAGSATEQVFEAIRRSRNGMSFADIQAKTGFVDKKIRNIIFRLHKLGKIKRQGRGQYVAA